MHSLRFMLLEGKGWSVHAQDSLGAAGNHVGKQLTCVGEGRKESPAAASAGAPCRSVEDLREFGWTNPRRQ